MKYPPLFKCGFLAVLMLIAACTPATPEPTATATATSTPLPTDTPRPTDTATFTPTHTATATPSKMPTASDTATPLATDTATLPPTPRFSPTPRATNTPTQPPTPPLFTVIQQTQQSVQNLGGALDRLYHGSGAEGCAPLLSDFRSVANAPGFDVSGQPSNVQTAYALYREAITFITDPNKVDKIRVICEAGGGTMSALDFDVARIAINDANDRLGQALNQLGTP